MWRRQWGRSCTCVTPHLWLWCSVQGTSVCLVPLSNTQLCWVTIMTRMFNWIDKWGKRKWAHKVSSSPAYKHSSVSQADSFFNKLESVVCLLQHFVNCTRGNEKSHPEYGHERIMCFFVYWLKGVLPDEIQCLQRHTTRKSDMMFWVVKQHELIPMCWRCVIVVQYTTVHVTLTVKMNCD